MNSTRPSRLASSWTMLMQAARIAYSRAAYSLATMSDVILDLWCQFGSCSANATPLPFTV
jgi:hypothetical protein